MLSDRESVGTSLNFFLVTDIINFDVSYFNKESKLRCLSEN